MDDITAEFCDATLPAVADRFLVEKTLFEVAIVDRKIGARVAALRCPECGRRGYCLKHCRRAHLRGDGVIDELDLRWQYVAQLVFSVGAELLLQLGRAKRSEVRCMSAR